MKVLLVEDDAGLREGMVELISDLAVVREAGSVREALAALSEEAFSLVITDLRIGGSSDGGRTILEAARRRLHAVAVVSAAAQHEVVQVMRPHEPDAVLAKPFQLDDMLSLVEGFLSLQREVEQAGQQRPGEAGWREVSEGVHVAEQVPGQRAWVRMSAGSSFSWEVHRGRQGVLLVEGELEVDGERRVGPHYFFLAAGPRPVRTRSGCLAVSLALRH
jgi:CheY-like chemotaxis protein